MSDSDEKPGNRGREKAAANSGRTADRPPGRPFPKGVSGNPSGRPRGSGRLSKAYASILGERHPTDPNGRTFADVIAERLATAAAEGDVTAAREITDRTEGKPTQRVENVHLRERFERMTPEELLRYAENGALPPWWNAEEGQHEAN